MIYVSLMGGLGNQLFQYAFAHYLVASGLGVDGLLTNAFDADQYGRQVNIAAVSSLPVLRLDQSQVAQCALLRDEDGERLRATLRQRCGAPEPLVCVGYWQDARYAAQVRELLLAQLAPAAPAPAPPAPCMLHVRRRDYGHHGLLPLSYYLAALEAAGWPQFQVITDEPNFSAHVFRATRGFLGVRAAAAGDSPWPDFHAMSQARIQIIANSSFSWWTAWLGQACGQTTAVFAPSQWSLLTPDEPLVAGWQRIECRLQRP